MYFTFQGTYQDTGHTYNYYDCTGAYEQLGNSATTDKGRGEGEACLEAVREKDNS